MSRLKLFLLGPPRIEQDGTILTVMLRKALALLVYLAVTRQPHSRDALATLFWPESDQQTARANLRRTLYQLTQSIDKKVLDVQAETLGLAQGAAVWLDVAAFRQAIETHLPVTDAVDALDAAGAEHLAQAVVGYRDDFLAGFHLSDCPAFDDWQFFQREDLRQQLARALQALMAFHTAQASYEQAIVYARRWLALDPLHEPAQQGLMRLYALAGQRAAALRQYEECTRILDVELGVPPEEETVALYEAIRARRFPAEALTPEPPTPQQPEQITAALPPMAGLQDPAAYCLPINSTPLVGREDEKAQLHNLMASPDCRLVTITGLGGMGKTSLALDFAHHLRNEHAQQFPDGLVFISLADANGDLSTTPPPVYAVADALNLSLSAQIPPLQQLLAALRSKQLLLILDNVEHLLQETTSPLAGESMIHLIAAILNATDQIKILVTSREPLRMSAEWRFNLEGLDYPSEDVLENDDLAQSSRDTWAECSAVRLFSHFARQSQPTFEITDRNAFWVSRLCRLAMGSPLALKLAAAWVRVLTCQRIVTGIEENLDILSTQMRDVPERQRSMRAVFDYTWHLLAPDEQRVLRRLSLFRGGFDEAAAQQIAAATPAVLAGLLDRGLIEVQAGTYGIRYWLHELVRQYAAEKLAAQPEERHQIRMQHSDYFCRFCLDLVEPLFDRGQAEALAAMQVEIENVQSAWDSFLDWRDFDALQHMSEPLYRYFWTRGRAREGQEVLSRTLAYLEQVDDASAPPHVALLLCSLFHKRGSIRYFLSDYENARQDILRAVALASQHGIQQEERYGPQMLGSIARWQGNREIAEDLLLKSLNLHRSVGDRSGQADALHELAQLYIHFGDYEKVEPLAMESLSISRELGRLDWIAWALDVLGWLSFRLGRYPDARRYYQESLTQFREVGHQLGIALALGGLAIVAWASGDDLPQAQRFWEQSLAICRRLGHQFYICSRLYGLAQLHNDIGDYDTARRYAREGLAIARPIQNAMFTTFCLCALAEAAYCQGDLEGSREEVLEAIQFAREAKLRPPLFVALLYFATLNVIESERGHLDESLQWAKRVEAVHLLNELGRHSAGWMVFRERAAHLLSELRRKWPPAVFAAAEDTESVTLETVAAHILERAGEPQEVAW